MSKKSILEEALLQVQNLEEAVKTNAKGILASTMKQELSELLKESMEHEDDVDTEEISEQPTPEEDEKDMSTETSDDDTEDNTDDANLDNEVPGTDSLDTDSVEDTDSLEDGDDLEDDTSFGGESLDSEPTDDEDVLDMTGASHDEVLKVFKAMKPEDGIVVKKDGDNISFGTGEDDYIIKLNDGELPDSDVADPTDMSGEGDDHSDDLTNELEEGDTAPFQKEVKEEDEQIYEIELDDEEANDEDVEESARTIGNGYHGGLKSKQKYAAGNKRDEINEEVSKLKKQNSEYKKALILFKDKLNEVAVFNANLAYATRLFTEHSTTKKEKLDIMKRFDSVSTMNESKNLFTSIKSELETKKPVTESVVEKISSTPSTSSSTEVLAESKAYENPQFARMKDLMKKLK